jgi:spore maturation protein CgeB
MRLQRITLNYDAYLEDFCRRHSGLQSLSYTDQYKLLMADAFGWADFLTRNLEPLGWEVWEPVTNFQAHQKRWAAEKGMRVSDRGWLHEIAGMQIEQFAPDVLFVDSFKAFPPEFISEIRSRVPSLRLVVGWCGAPPGDYGIFKGFDLTLSNIPIIVDNLRRRGHRAELLPHSFETSLLGRLAARERSLDFTFSGSIFLGSGIHDHRLRQLAEILKKSNLQVYASITKPKMQEVLALLRRSRFSDLRRQLSQLLDQTIVAKKAYPPVFGMAMYEMLSNSRVTYNNHIGLSDEHASNTRLFQATGCGACLLTDWKPDLHRYFELDNEVVTYRTPEEACEKAHHLFENEALCAQIAKAGQNRTLKDHSFASRCADLDRIFKQWLN